MSSLAKHIAGTLAIIATLTAAPVAAASLGMAGNLAFGSQIPNKIVVMPRAGLISAAYKVCVYEDLFFKGASTCWTGPRTSNTLPARWNNRISSVRVWGGATVKLCRDQNLQGDCSTFASDAPGIGMTMMKQISSLKSW